MLLFLTVPPSNPRLSGSDGIAVGFAATLRPALIMLAIITTVVAVVAWREHPKWWKWQLGGVVGWIAILVFWFAGHYRGP